MSTIGAVTFLKNTQMSRDNGIVFDFNDESEREEWTNTFTAVSVPIKIKDYNGPIVVNVATSLISAATNTNYDYAFVTDYTGRTYYYYVNGWKYVTDDVYMCMLTLDTFMTYHALQGTATYLPSIIERQHYDRVYYDGLNSYPIFHKISEPLPTYEMFTTRYNLNTSSSSSDIRKYVDSWYILYMRVVVGGVDRVQRFLTFKWNSVYVASNWTIEVGLNNDMLLDVPMESTDTNILSIEKLPAIPTFDSYTIDIPHKIIHLYKTTWIMGGDPSYWKIVGYYGGLIMDDIDISTYVNNACPIQRTYFNYANQNSTYNYLKETKIYTSQFIKARVEYGASSFYINREDYDGDEIMPTKIKTKKFLDMSLTANFTLDELPYQRRFTYDYVPITLSTLPTYSSEYMSYIRTRDANLAIRNASTTLSIGLSTATLIAGIAMSATGAAAPAGAAAIFSSVAALTGQIANAGIAAAQEQQKLKDLELQGRAVMSQTTGAESEGVTRINTFNFIIERIDVYQRQAIALMLHITGYYCGRLETPNITSRYSFNSIKGDIDFKMPDDKQIPLAHYIDLKERYRNGLMIIHYRHASVSWAALDSYARVIALCNIEVTAITPIVP